MEDVLLICFEQIVSFCTLIYSNSNSHQLFYENSNLNVANLKKTTVIFCVKSWKFYPSPKIFYLSATCATCDKFHVWSAGANNYIQQFVQKG